MQCPRCKNVDTRVVDSRTSEEGRCIRRRRRCEQCGHRFTTFEREELSELIVQKSDGTSEPYSREKLEKGVWLACGKRPVTRENVDLLITKLEEEWFQEREVSSQRIGEDLMRALKDLDDIAYIRFASVYREFRDVEDFQKEISDIFFRKKKKNT
jgi:transcriptional repressor NrdR